MSPALLAYVARSFVATQRYVAPVVALLLVAVAILTSPPLDVGAGQIMAIAQLAGTAWIVHLASGLESDAQAAVTAARCGSRRAVLLAKVLVGWVVGLAIPAAVCTVGLALGSIRPGAIPLWVTATTAPSLAGAGIGALAHAALPERAGYATLAVLAFVVADLAVPHAPPLNLLVGNASGADSARLLAAVAWSLVIGASGVAGAAILTLRR